MSDLISRKAAIEAITNTGSMVAYHDASESVMFGSAFRQNEIIDIIKALPSADRPKGMIHIDEVYRLIAGHSNYHGDSILSAFTCLVEGKNVKPIAPLDESADRPTGKWLKRQTVGDVDFAYCSKCGKPIIHGRTSPLWNYCPNCGAKMEVKNEP